ncbi:MAG TPA: DUF4124 domain-containing protein [Burkholderiales bacterium]|nr:DUF4124 domain-containing protein [Burkholderiales bacterium]
MRYLFPPFILCLCAAPALADTCKYVDNEGRTIYSNVPIKNARKLTCFQEPAPPPEAKPRSEQAPSGASDAGQKRVEPGTQRKRDDDRRKILEDELAREQKGLEDAKKALAEQQAQRTGDERNYARVQERLKPLQEAVSTHEKNISSLRQELLNLK